MAQAAPESIPAASSGTMNNLSFGGWDRVRGRAFAYYETIAGGMGASPRADGASATHTHMTNSWNTPVEAFEHSVSAAHRAIASATDSGGTGKHRGGDAIVREFEFLTTRDVTILSDRRERGPYGLSGGSARSARQEFAVARQDAASRSQAKRASKCNLTMSCASNRPAEAATANQSDALRRVAMRQTWRRLTFLHWAYDPDLVRGFIPPGLELDTFDNAAWVGLVPFEIHGLRGIPHFPETNLRTYVVGPGGSPAVWFFSLEAARLAAVLGARIGYHLPYFWAKMRVIAKNDAIHYSSRRHRPHDPSARTDIVVRPGEPYKSEELTEHDRFLTARYRLYSTARGRLKHAQIEHSPWPLARASVVHLRETLFAASGLPPPHGTPSRTTATN